MAGYTRDGYSCDYAFYDGFGLLVGYNDASQVYNLPISLWFAGQQGVETTLPGTNGDYLYNYNPQYNYPGLLLMGLRWYNPTNGRFYTRDPQGYEGGINLYALTLDGLEDQGSSRALSSQESARLLEEDRILQCRSTRAGRRMSYFAAV